MIALHAAHRGENPTEQQLDEKKNANANATATARARARFATPSIYVVRGHEPGQLPHLFWTAEALRWY